MANPEIKAEKKNRFFVGGINKNIIPANTPLTELCSVQNSTGTKIQSKGIKIVYKDIDLSDCLITCDLQNRTNNPIFQGDVTLGNIGQLQSSNQAHEFIPFANAIELLPSQVVKFKITTFAKAVQARDISIILMVED